MGKEGAPPVTADHPSGGEVFHISSVCFFICLCVFVFVYLVNHSPAVQWREVDSFMWRMFLSIIKSVEKNDKNDG